MASTTTASPVGISWSHRLTLSVAAMIVAVLVTVALIASLSGGASHSTSSGRANLPGDCLVRSSFHWPC
jgi:hypothetical protein